MNLQGKTVLLGVTGSIAAYKSANIARMCKKAGADVQVLMTKNATNFINPITFESLTGNKCLIDTFDRNFQYSVEHVALAKRASVFLVAPASANVIGKIAGGIADDMLTTTIMACTCPKLVAPAMNHNMYHNPIVQDNLKRLEGYGYTIITPATGMLANGDLGDGRMPEESLLFSYVEKEIACEKDLAGKKILVTAGPTREALDPVRYLTNHSTGKMGYAIAWAAACRGAEVTLVSGPTSLDCPLGVKRVDVISAQDMYEAVMEAFPEQDMVIKAAAVADYRPAEVATEKVKKKDGELSIPLQRTRDILGELGQKKRPGQVLCGFSMETEHMLENTQAKLEKKKVDMMVANNLKVQGAGFGTDTNIVTLITADGAEELPKMLS